MRILFVVLAERGHLRAPVAIAQRLERAGHDVAFFALGDISQIVRDAGLRAVLFNGAEETRAAKRPLRHDVSVSWLAKHWELATQMTFAPRILEAVTAAVDAFAPDIMAIDPIAYHGIAIAEARKIPWAAISTTLVMLAPPTFTCPMFQAYARFADARATLFRAHGIHHPVRANEVVSPWLNVVFTTEELVPKESDDQVFRVGPALPLAATGTEVSFPWERLRADRPLVYVSFGGGDALAFPVETFPKIFGAVREDAAQLVAVLHHLVDDPSMAELPAHVLAVRLAPQVALLKKMSAVVTHGGANTMMECLAAGLPMVVVPIGYEQPLQAHFVARARVGIHLPLADLTTESCHDALEAVLAPNSSFRAEAERVAASYAANDGAARAASLLEELAATRRPAESR